MKKRIALILAFVLCLSLCACGQGSAHAPADQKPANAKQNDTESQQEQTAETTAGDYFVEEEILVDGGKSTTYRVGSPNGVIAKITREFVDGSYTEERYDSEGKLEYSIHSRPDSYVWEQYFYPSGNVSKDIMKSADGSSTEKHFLDNGSIDEATGTVTSGATTYEKHVTADGQVNEITHDIDVEDDGTYWFNYTGEDGSIEKTHFDTDNKIIEAIRDNEATGDHAEIEYVNGIKFKEIQTNKNNDNRMEITYYESGKMKSLDTYDANRKERTLIEYYENNSVKHLLQEADDGYKHEEKYNEAGYTTYYYDSNQDMEFFADDVGELLKCISKGQTYEGDAIPSEERQVFEQVRQVPDENADATEETVPAETASALDSIQVEDGYHEEYYPSGKLKHITNKTADMFIEISYDEDGYFTYFHQVDQGIDLEITCDETGKVDKVLVDGQVQTDIENIVKDMFFRSW